MKNIWPNSYLWNDKNLRLICTFTKLLFNHFILQYGCDEDDDGSIVWPNVILICALYSKFCTMQNNSIEK